MRMNDLVPARFGFFALTQKSPEFFWETSIMDSVTKEGFEQIEHSLKRKLSRDD
jgi:hypothetical protein